MPSPRVRRNDRLVSETLPLGQTTRHAYDAAGNRVERIDALGQKAVFTYDALNRLTQTRRFDAQGVLVRTTTQSWDDNGNLVAWSDTDATRPSGEQLASAVLTYDDADRKTGETVTYPDGTTLRYAWSYSAAGRKTRLTWADGTAIEYAYSAHGELQSVTIPGEGIFTVTQFKWKAPASVLLPGGTVQEHARDGLLKLESLTVRNPGQQTLLALRNTYGLEQELTHAQRTDAAAGGTTRTDRYGYDAETRLTSVHTNSDGAEHTQTYTLDAVGNRTAHSEVQGAWTHDANNRLLQRGEGESATSYEYDDNGNLRRKAEPGRVTEYRYDTQNRLVEVRDGTRRADRALRLRPAEPAPVEGAVPQRRRPGAGSGSAHAVPVRRRGLDRGGDAGHHLERGPHGDAARLTAAHHAVRPDAQLAVRHRRAGPEDAEQQRAGRVRLAAPRPPGHADPCDGQGGERGVGGPV